MIENEPFKPVLNLVEQDEIAYSINEEEKTAGIFNYQSSKNEIIIPRSIKHKSKEYIIISIEKSAFSEQNNLKSVQFDTDSQLQTIGEKAFYQSSIESILIPAHVTKICKYAFSMCYQLEKIEFPPNSELQIIEEEAFFRLKIKSISIPASVRIISEGAFFWCQQLSEIIIPPNSELQVIEDKAFSHSLIESISFPASLVELKDGWCRYTKLTSIKVDPRNPRYLFLDGKYLVGKSDLSKENYDILLFAARNIVEAKIPTFIKVIKSYSFQNCSMLKVIENPSNSELLTIEKDALSSSSIEKISIPASLVDLQEGWCVETDNLTTIEIDPKNPRYSCIDDKFIIGKSDISKGNYDTLVFSARDIVEAKIPSFIKIIGPYSFVYCLSLQLVEFPPNSELLTIGTSAFSYSTIKRILIPPSVTKICERAFYRCEEFRQIEFMPNSNIQIFDEEAFYLSAIEKISIPFHLKEIRKAAFLCCQNLQQIDFPPNSELQLIDEDAFCCALFESFLVPKHVTKVGNDAFSDCEELQIIEIDENSELQSFEMSVFNDNSIIMIPVQKKHLFTDHYI